MQIFHNAYKITSALIIGTLMALPQPTLAASSQSHVFNLYIKGWKAGTISTAAKKTTKRYALSGNINPSALLRMLRDVGYNGTASGSYSGAKYRPAKYTGHIKTGKRNSTVKMRFVKGKPIVDSYLPSREKRKYDITPEKQKGVIDLLTAAHSVFEDSTAKGLCNRTIPMFDGRRRSKLTLSKPKKTSKGATCRGKYTRLKGFSPHDMQKRVNFPFTLVYDQKDDGNYRLMSFHTKTTFGDAKAVRK